MRALQRRRDLSRLVRPGLAGVLAVALICGWVYRMQHAVISLHAQGVVVEPDGGRRVIPAQSRVSLVPGARVLAPDVDLGHGVLDRSEFNFADV